MQADREAFDRRESKATGSTLAGLEYDTHLAGPAGADCVLYILPDTKSEQIMDAKAEAKHRFDVVSFHLAKIEPAWLEQEKFEPGEPTGWLAAARWVVEHGMARRLHPKTGELIPENKRGGTLLDLFSASAMVQVYDALNETNKAKLAGLPVVAAHDLVFRLLDKSA